MKQENAMDLKTIYLAGGCFWGTEKYLSALEGVVTTEVGYANGRTENPSYEDVCYKNTGHAETVKVEYDANVLPLKDLLILFYEVIDPVSINRQGNDVGTQYRSAIFTHNDTQAQIAREMKSWVAQVIEQTVVTEIVPFIAEQYTRAEDYHQEYFEHNPENSYCQMVIPYKLSKLRANFVGMLK